MRRAFTLLEVVAVVVVVSILGSIAVVASSSIRDDVQDRAAQAALQRVISAQRAHAAGEGVWADGSQLSTSIGLEVTDGVAVRPGVVSITPGPGRTVGIAILSDSGACLASVLNDPLTDGRAVSVQIGGRSPCSGGGALASLP